MFVLSLREQKFVVLGGVREKKLLNAWLQIIKRLHSICQLQSTNCLNWVRGAMWKKTKVMFTFRSDWVYSSGLINVLSPFLSSFLHLFFSFALFQSMFASNLLLRCLCWNIATVLILLSAPNIDQWIRRFLCLYSWGNSKYFPGE